MNYIFTLTNGQKLNVDFYTDNTKGYLINGKQLTFKEVKEIEPNFETAFEEQELNNTYFFIVETGRKNSDCIIRRNVIIKAKSESEANEKIDKRFPNAYDIQLMNGD